MNISFHKYQGTGNDFILIDNRELALAHDNHTTYAKWCDRRFGVGADGLILIESALEVDFRMVYFNANGQEGSMCGNGGRCAVHFARHLGIIKSEAKFLAVDGLHEANIKEDTIELKMIDVDLIENLDADFYIDTGSPHHVEFVTELDKEDTFSKGKSIRYNDRYRGKGTNVNFVEIVDTTSCKVSTYERGVEDLTMSCGTGVTAVAIAMLEKQNAPTGKYRIGTENKGGQLDVQLEKVAEKQYKNIWLTGPAAISFTGVLNLREG